MKHDEMQQRQFEILNSLSWLPRKMLSLHGTEHMTEFVLRELCNEHCFNFEKAAYLVDNPDFDCLKGVVGLSRKELASNAKNSEELSVNFQNSDFNKKVRNFARCSLKRDCESEKDIAELIAKNLDLRNFGYCSLGFKHDNHGLLVFEKACQEDQVNEDYLLNGLSLLSFCPIF